jgi:tRNA pseudouridine(38-40) synthase
LDDHLLPGLCKQLEGEHDYGAFVHKEDRHTRNNVMKLSRFDYAVLEETNEYVPIVNARFHLQAGGFGRTMIRNLVGFVVDLSRGKVDAKHVADIWSPENANLVCAAPASGLCLEKVWL